MEIVENPVVINGDIPHMPSGQHSEDDIDIGKIQDEIRNIRKVIQLTKDSLDELNKKFGNDQQPNPMYVEEYETLTNKIHELQVKEEDLLAKMPNEEDRSPTCSLPASTSGGGAQPNISNSIPSPKPVHGIIKAYLPNEQFSLVKIEPGKILKEGLKKSMSRRFLSPENCNVYDSTTKMPISWDIDMANLAGKDINVCEKPKRKLEGQLAITTHNIVRKTFLLLTFCDGCGKSLFQSLRCQTCGIRFHQRCSDKIQPFCYPVPDSLPYPGMFKPQWSLVAPSRPPNSLSTIPQQKFSSRMYNLLKLLPGQSKTIRERTGKSMVIKFRSTRESGQGHLGRCTEGITMVTWQSNALTSQLQLLNS
uniref:B-Raf proto-oncogene serine/threonine-protein kinase n=1 Tax=Magallana gigas TaxID=29159 RepID=K1PUV0_MAGGI